MAPAFFQVISDLHLESSPLYDFDIKRTAPNIASLVILAKSLMMDYSYSSRGYSASTGMFSIFLVTTSPSEPAGKLQRPEFMLSRRRWKI